MDRRTRAFGRVDDLGRRRIENGVVVRLHPNANTLLSGSHPKVQ